MNDILGSRKRELESSLNKAYTLLSQYENLVLTDSSPRGLAQKKNDMKLLRQQIGEMVEELKSLSVSNIESDSNSIVKVPASSYPVYQSIVGVASHDNLLALPFASCKLYFAGPGDGYAFYAQVTTDSRPSEIVALRDVMLESLVKAGFSVVRDRNLPEFARVFDQDKVRYLMGTCDGICALCYPKEETENGWLTSPHIIEELRYALETDVKHIVVFVEESVKDPMLEELLERHALRIIRRKASVKWLRNLNVLYEQLVQPWENIKLQDHSVFVTIPFDDSYSELFQIVSAVVWDVCHLPCHRSKDVALGTATEEVNIHQAIMSGIKNSPFVIMVLPINRPNCYFEAGLAAAYNRPAIRIMTSLNNIPFNIMPWTIISAQIEGEQGKEAFRQELRRELSRFAREEVTLYKLVS